MCVYSRLTRSHVVWENIGIGIIIESGDKRVFDAYVIKLIWPVRIIGSFIYALEC